MILPHRLTGREAINEGLTYDLEVLSSDTYLEPKAILGLPIELTIPTDQGAERRLCGVEAAASQLGSKGGFSVYQLKIEPGLAALSEVHTPSIRSTIQGTAGACDRTGFRTTHREQVGYVPVEGRKRRECSSGGAWNLHIHAVVILWGHRISYTRLWDEWQTAVGERSQVDIDRLHTLNLQKARRKGGLAAAARYVTKYLSKVELTGIRKGPGGLAHYVGATRRLRSFAMGGGASVLRRMVPVLLPNWARRLEGMLEDAHLRGGMPAFRQEEINPETGEVLEVPILGPSLDAQERAEARALAGPLLQMGDTVGEVCGPKGRWRRIGEVPGRSPGVKVKDLEARKKPQGVRALVAGGDWRIFEERESMKGGGVRITRVALPGRRYAWRDVSRVLQKLLAQDGSGWGQRRKEAFRAWAEARMRVPETEAHGICHPGAFTWIRWIGGKPVEDRVVVRTPATRPTQNPEPVPSQIALDTRRAFRHGLEGTEGRVGTHQRKEAWKRLVLLLDTAAS